MNNHDFSHNTTPDSDQTQNEARNTENTTGGDGFPPINDPQWYGVSYQNEHVQNRAGQTAKKKPKRRKIALIAAIVAACILFSGLTLFGGVMVAKRVLADAIGNTEPNNTLTPGETNNGSTQSTVYDSKGADQYDFSSVLLQKNDGSNASLKYGSAGENPKLLTEAVAMVQDSVVEIVTTKTSVRGTVSAGAGSGVIINEEGIIVTNNHVVSGYTEIYVIVTDHSQTDETGAYKQTRYEAYVRGTDEDGDIAILKINPTSELTVAKLGCSSNIVLAEEVFAIGNPLGELGGTVTNGIISSISRQVQIDGVTMTLLQTNAAINSGNSGGGLFNLAGELIGIVNAKYSASGVEGLGFAIPIDSAMKSIEDILQYGYVRGVPGLGVTVASGYYGSGFAGVPVVYVYDAGNSEVLKTDDIIRSIDGKSVSEFSDLKQIIRSHLVGDTVELTILRNRQTMTVSVTLVEYNPKGQ